ncbi:sugar-binding transcriptional regulator [Litchfieldia salsa]|uniref:Central glycolytic genes regulator n=1 Tax=Litchfieldia salsa TaxID=930152 RepID=A0A1H0WBC4_9BACI|nr:sugar-binding domain-containing protein [Litchfieldia salsa]SDP88060.1 central glycolytic genes regulator [Litchfieldia salsa]
MRSLVDVQKRLLPDILPVMQKRYEILKYIRLMQPIGRRNLSISLGQSERILRTEVQFLKDQKLIDAGIAGMTITKDGAFVLNQLEDIIKEISGLNVLENELKEKLQIKDVIVVAGDSDQFPWVKKELGRACVKRIKSSLTGNNIVAVNGGTTLADIAEMMTPDPKNKEILFVPGRGGLGEQVENQANTICAKMAERASGNYRLLHVPDVVSNETYQTMINEPSIREVLELIKSSSIVIHGIGDAITMAERRKTAPDDVKKIIDGNAVAEAFGYYFNEDGRVVHKVQTIGLQLEDLANVEHVIAVAGGASKAMAIQAYLKQAHDTLLITDEGAAKELIRG